MFELSNVNNNLSFILQNSTELLKLMELLNEPFIPAEIEYGVFSLTNCTWGITNSFVRVIYRNDCCFIPPLMPKYGINISLNNEYFIFTLGNT